MSQQIQILTYLKKHNGITAVEALNHCGCFRLAARIHDLRMQGHRIESTRVETKNGSVIARYFLRNRKRIQK